MQKIIIGGLVSLWGVAALIYMIHKEDNYKEDYYTGAYGAGQFVAKILAGVMAVVGFAFFAVGLGTLGDEKRGSRRLARTRSRDRRRRRDYDDEDDYEDYDDNDDDDYDRPQRRRPSRRGKPQIGYGLIVGGVVILAVIVVALIIVLATRKKSTNPTPTERVTPSKVESPRRGDSGGATP
jgi:uncharacterized membrane protein